MLAARHQPPRRTSGRDSDNAPINTTVKQHGTTSTAPSDTAANYLTFAANRPRAPLLVPAAVSLLSHGYSLIDYEY